MKAIWIKPRLEDFGTIQQITLQGAGKELGPGDGLSDPNGITCPPGHFKNGVCDAGDLS